MNKLLLLPLLLTLPLYGKAKKIRHHNCKHDVAAKNKHKPVIDKKSPTEKSVKRIVNYQLVIKEY